MKNKLFAGFILVVFGAAFLFAAYRFAPLAWEAPRNLPNSVGYASTSIVEFAYGFPAAVFTVVGTASIIAGVVVASVVLLKEPRP